MAGYEDTKRLIIETLMGRPSGTEIQPENHQTFALSMLEYIRSIELISGSSVIDIANENTVPVQPDNSRVSYISGIAQNRTITFQNFIGQDGEALSVTTGDMECYLIILLWNTEYWSLQAIPSNIISKAENATFYYRYNIRKTYKSVSSMNSDSTNPIGTDGKTINIGDIVSVVNSSDSSENAIYSRTDSGWQFQSGMNFALVQETGDDVNSAMSQYAVTKELTKLEGKLGNKILEWNTDVATTRKQVPSSERKQGLQISYKLNGTDWVNEQYVSTSITDTGWSSDTNWKRIAYRGDIGLLNVNAINDIAYTLETALPVALAYLQANGILRFKGFLITYKTNNEGSANKWELAQYLYDGTQLDTNFSNKNNWNIFLNEEKVYSLINEKNRVNSAFVNLNLYEDIIYSIDTAIAKSYDLGFQKKGLVITYKVSNSEWEQAQYKYVGILTETNFKNASNWEISITKKDIAAVEENISFFKLDWDTDAYTTRNKVPTEKRKSGVIITYKNNLNEVICEQAISYLSSTSQDSVWGVDSSWVRIKTTLNDNIININNYEDIDYTLETAISKLLSINSYNLYVKPGFCITFRNNNDWFIYQYSYTNLNQISSTRFWIKISTEKDVDTVKANIYSHFPIFDLNIYEDIDYTLETAISKVWEIEEIPKFKGMSIKYCTDLSKRTYEIKTYIYNGTIQEIRIKDPNYWADFIEVEKIVNQAITSFQQIKAIGNSFNWGTLPKNKEDVSILQFGNSFGAQVSTFWDELLEASNHTEVIKDSMAIGGTTYDYWIDRIKKELAGEWKQNETGGYDPNGTANTNMIDKLRERKWDIVIIQNLSGASWTFDSNYPQIVEYVTLIRSVVRNRDLAIFVYCPPSRPGIAPDNPEKDSTLLLYLINTCIKNALISNGGVPMNRLLFGGTAMQNLRKHVKDMEGEDRELTYDNLHPFYGLPYLATGALCYQLIFEQIFDNINYENDMANIKTSYTADFAEGTNFSKVLNIGDSNRKYAVNAVKSALIDNWEVSSELPDEDILEITNFVEYNEQIISENT